uniref:FGFR1 oncogene partner 2 n=1 Tax=Ursus americanus TaxID=9643 RepID=A0A452QYI8_URSAM
MSCTIEKSLADANTLVERWRDQDDLSKSRSNEAVPGRIQELNEVARRRPQSTLVMGIQQENRQIREVQQENKELYTSLEEHQSDLELIISKYQEQMFRQLNFSQMSLAQTGAGLRYHQLWFALCGFCSLKAFRAALEDENENGGLPISSPGAESLGARSLVRPQGKAVNRSCLPGLQPHSVLTRPVTERFYLWHTAQFGVSKPSRFRLPCRSSRGRKGSLPGSAACWAPYWKSRGPTVPGITVYGHPKLGAHSSAQSLQPASPLRYLGALPHSGTPSLPVTPRVLRPHCPSEGSNPHPHLATR